MRRIITILIALIVLAGIAFGAWIAYTKFFLTPLTTYEGDGFSVSVPENYVEDSFAGYTAFAPEGATDDARAWGSGVMVMKSEIDTELRTEIEDGVRSMISGEEGSTSMVMSSSVVAENYDTNEASDGDRTTFTSTATIAEESGEQLGELTRIITFTPTAYYTLYVGVAEGNRDLEVVKDDIIESLRIE